MKRLIFFFLVLQSAAKAETVLNFFTKDSKIEIYKYEDSRVSSTVKCTKLDRGHFCDELAFLKDLKNYKLKTMLHSGQSYGSAVCNEKLKGIVVVAKTKIGDENAFCRLKNNFYVELGTLGYYLNLK